MVDGEAVTYVKPRQKIWTIVLKKLYNVTPYENSYVFHGHFILFELILHKSDLWEMMIIHEWSQKSGKMKVDCPLINHY